MELEGWKLGGLEGCKVGCFLGWRVGNLEGWKLGRSLVGGLEAWRVGGLQGWLLRWRSQTHDAQGRSADFRSVYGRARLHDREFPECLWEGGGCMTGFSECLWLYGFENVRSVYGRRRLGSGGCTSENFQSVYGRRRIFGVFMVSWRLQYKYFPECLWEADVARQRISGEFMRGGGCKNN